MRREEVEILVDHESSMEEEPGRDRTSERDIQAVEDSAARKPRRRRRVSLARAFVGNKVDLVGKKLNTMRERFPFLFSAILVVNSVGQLVIFAVDIVSDVTLTYVISGNEAVKYLYDAMLAFIVLQYVIGIIGLNMYFKKDLFQDPMPRLKVGDEVEARKPHWNYETYQRGKVTAVHDDHTYDIEPYLWSYKQGCASSLDGLTMENVKPLEIKNYDMLKKTFYTARDLREIRRNRLKRVVGFILSPILVLIFDVLILVYRPFQRYFHHKFLAFIVQYETLRILVEVIFESVPQAIIQTMLYFKCLGGVCGFADSPNDFLTTSQTLTISLAVSILNIIRLSVSTYIAITSMGISIRQYTRHLFLLGSGLNLDAIHENACTTLRFYGLTDAEIRQLVPVLKKNKSTKEFYIDWENLSDDQVALFINGTNHPAVLANFISNMPLLYPKGSPFIVACEKGLLELVKFWVENFRNAGSEFDGMSDFINQRGKAVGGYRGYTGLIIAAKMEQSQVIEFLLAQETIDATIVREGTGRNVIHYAAYYNRRSLATLKALLNHEKCSLDLINAKSADAKTPLDYANVNTGDLRAEIVKLLESKGAKRNQRTRAMSMTTTMI